MKQAIMVDEKARMGYIIKMEERMEMLRIKAKLSQGDLAQLSGFSRQNYNMVANGKHHLSWRNYLALLFIFDNNCSTHSLLRELGIWPNEFVSALNGNAASQTE